MKIIKSGKKKSPVMVARLKCWMCDCVFEVEESDFCHRLPFEELLDLPALNMTTTQHCLCPECGFNYFKDAPYWDWHKRDSD